MGWRNASLRPLDEQPGWDTSIKGTGVVREEPLAAALWPAQRSKAMQQAQSRPDRSQTGQQEAHASLSEAGQQQLPASTSGRQPQQQAHAANSHSSPAQERGEQPEPSQEEQAAEHTLTMLARLRVSTSPDCAPLLGLRADVAALRSPAEAVPSQASKKYEVLTHASRCAGAALEADRCVLQGRAHACVLPQPGAGALLARASAALYIVHCKGAARWARWAANLRQKVCRSRESGWTGRVRGCPGT